MTQSILPLIADGSYLMTLSSSLIRTIYSGYAAYASVNSALEVLTQYTAQELGARRVTVNIVSLGVIWADFGEGNLPDDPDLKKTFASMTARGRVTMPDDIRPIIARCLSHNHRCITSRHLTFRLGKRY